MNISIVGLGLIGGSLALDLRKQGFATRIIGVESRPQNAKRALERGIADQVTDLETAAQSSELVILAIPVNAIEAMLPRVLDLIPDRTTVTDMGSTKERICTRVASHPKRKQYVASHPMAGTENSGPDAALMGLFDGKTAVLCDERQSGLENLRVVESMYQRLRMRIIRMSSTDHDLHAAYVSHLSHISSFVLANTVLAEEKNVATIFDLAGGGFESTVRLAKSSPEMWAPIFEQNREHVSAALEAYIEHLQKFRSALSSGRADQLQDAMQDANRIRGVLEQIGGRKA